MAWYSVWRVVLRERGEGGGRGEGSKRRDEGERGKVDES